MGKNKKSLCGSDNSSADQPLTVFRSPKKSFVLAPLHWWRVVELVLVSTMWGRWPTWLPGMAPWVTGELLPLLPVFSGQLVGTDGPLGLQGKMEPTVEGSWVWPRWEEYSQESSPPRNTCDGLPGGQEANIGCFKALRCWGVGVVAVIYSSPPWPIPFSS